MRPTGQLSLPHRNERGWLVLTHGFGAILHDRELILPCAVSDFATVSLAAVLDAMT